MPGRLHGISCDRKTSLPCTENCGERCDIQHLCSPGEMIQRHTRSDRAHPAISFACHLTQSSSSMLLIRHLLFCAATAALWGCCACYAVIGEPAPTDCDLGTRHGQKSVIGSAAQNCACRYNVQAGAVTFAQVRIPINQNVGRRRIRNAFLSSQVVSKLALVSCAAVHAWLSAG